MVVVLDHRVVRISITTYEVNIQRLSRKSYSDRLSKAFLEVYIYQFPINFPIYN